VFERGGRTADNTDVTDWGAVAAAIWFETLAVASRPLQRRPRRNNLYFHHEKHEVQGDFELGNQERKNGIFEIEGKGAMGSAERVGRRASFKSGSGARLPAFLSAAGRTRRGELSLFDSFCSSCPPRPLW
jgi:hypothetical protein